MKIFHPIVAIAFSILFTSCNKVLRTPIGELNMISTRNIEKNGNYKLLVTYAGSSENEQKKSKAESIQEAVNQTVKKIDGAEYLMNVKIYLIDKKWFAVEGDAYGKEDIDYRGFKIGDRVSWKQSGEINHGVITERKGDKCFVKIDDKEKTVELNYDAITKSSNIPEISSSKLKVGDKVRYEDGFGKVIEGKILIIDQNTSVIVHTDSKGKTTNSKVKLERLYKIE